MAVGGSSLARFSTWELWAGLLGTLGGSAVVLVLSFRSQTAASAGLWAVCVALWMFDVAAVRELVRRRGQPRRWFPPGRCQRCGYDLRGSPYRCPECGDAWLMRPPPSK